MLKLVKFENEELISAINTGDAYIQIGNRKFMLFEIEEVPQAGYYEVTDPDEEVLLLEAMESYNPSLSKQELLEQLSRNNKQ